MAEHRRSRPQKKKNRWWIWLLVAAIIGLTAFAAWKSRQGKEGEKVMAEAVENRTITETVSASGKIFPQTEVSISSDVSGEIIALNVEEGDSVKIGQLLARIEPDAYESQVEQGRAGVSSAKAQLANAEAQISSASAGLERSNANLANAQQTYERFEKLYKEGTIALAEFESYEAQLKQAQADVKTAEAGVKSAKESARSSRFQIESSQANLKQLRTSLERTRILSPLTGVISMLSVEEGERVVGTIQMAGTEMMRIANLSAMEVQVEVSENDIPRVFIGNDVDVEVDAYLGRKFTGKVAEIANTAANLTSQTASLTSDQVVNFVVKINMNPDSYADLISPTSPFPFRPGMSASVEIKTKTAKDALTVPIQAVTTRDEDGKGRKSNEEDNEDDNIREVVFVIPADADTVKMLEIKTDIQDDTYIMIAEGLQAGDRVVTGPYNMISRKLKEGMKIEVVEEEELYKSDK